MAINLNDFIHNVVFLNDNVWFKIEENYFYIYPYGEKFDKIFYRFDFLDKKSISEKGIYRHNNTIAHSIIEKANERFYCHIYEMAAC